jgi:serine protease Do
VGFTVPINLARWVGDQLATTGRVTRAYLGVVIQQLDDKLARQFGVSVGKGALVTEILPGSPAAEGGVEVGDLVLKFNDRDVRGTRDLQSIVERCRAGESVPMQIVREGKDKTLGIVLKEMPQNFSMRRTGNEEGPGSDPVQPEKPVPGKVSELGMQVDTLSADVARQLGYKDGTKGVVVTSVDAEGPAATAGIREGLLIERVGQQRVGTVEEFQQAMKGADLTKGVLFLVRNPRGINTFIVVKK